MRNADECPETVVGAPELKTALNCVDDYIKVSKSQKQLLDTPGNNCWFALMTKRLKCTLKQFLDTPELKAALNCTAVEGVRV